MAKYKPGDKIGQLTVLAQTDKRDKKREIIWKCKCDCGNIVERATHYFRVTVVPSCGKCDYDPQIKAAREKELTEKLQNKQQNCDNLIKDLTGVKVGKLTYLYNTGKQGIAGNGYIWHCRCDCGNEIDVPIKSFNRRFSCGCSRSRNEVLIKELLIDNNISFTQEQTFNGLKYGSKGRPRFDFFVNDKYIIEYDGQQHFKQSIYSEDFDDVRARDLNKNQYCFNHNIPIIRIPYDVDYNIDDLKLETTRYLLTPENEKQYYESRA